MATRKTPRTRKQIETLTHDEASRKNIPTAELQSVMEKSGQTPIQIAYQRRNRDLDPQLVCRGKDEQDWSDLVVAAPPLFIQEEVHPRRQRSRQGATLKAEINEEAWETLHSDTSRPFDKPKSGRIAVKVINHLGDEVMKVFRV